MYHLLCQIWFTTKMAWRRSLIHNVHLIVLRNEEFFAFLAYPYLHGKVDDKLPVEVFHGGFDLLNQIGY